MEWSGTMWSSSSSQLNGPRTSSTSQWESLVTASPCDRRSHQLQTLLKLREMGGGVQTRPRSDTFPVEIWTTGTAGFRTSCRPFWCCWCCWVALLFFFFTHYEKNKYSFVRFVPPPQRYLERLPHFDIAAVFALSVQMLLFLWNPTLLLFYRRRKSVVVLCSGVYEIVFWCCWKYCCEFRWNPFLLVFYSSLYFF